MNEVLQGTAAPALIVIHSHPIQYFAPLYAAMATQGIRLQVWYCSDESVRGSLDKEFGTTVKWDIPLLEGYAYRFLHNHSFSPSVHNGFFGLINLGLIPALMRQRRSIILVHGWNYVSYLLAIVIGKLRGHSIYLRVETPLHQQTATAWKQWLKKLFLGKFLFSFIDQFLYIGQHNLDFYTHLGVRRADLRFAPYAVDNDRLQKAALALAPLRIPLREKMGIPANDFVILSVAKYIPKKRPLDLIQAFHQLAHPRAHLVMVGSGELQEAMNDYILQHAIPNIHLTGFVNQQDLVQYYALADLFVLCSGLGETWGLVVNEAMNFSLPILVSDMVGCAPDLIKSGVNGMQFKTGDVTELANSLQAFLQLPPDQLRQMGQRSLELVNQYHYAQTVALFTPARPA